MRLFSCAVARTRRQIQDAQRVRWQVYGEEEKLISAAACVEGRDLDPSDEQSHTVHILVYVGLQPVGTVRLLQAAAAVDGIATRHLGLDLESKFDLGAFATPGIVLAEIKGYCVVRRYRCTGVTKALYAGLRAESARRGITHWVAAANMETDFPEEAALAYEVARDMRLVSDQFCVERRALGVPSTPRRRSCYSEEERLLGSRGQRAGLALPRTLSLFATKMGARFMGAPVYDSHFKVFALPLVAALSALHG
jgi:putative hemolysin